MIVDTHTHLFAPDPVRYPLADPAASYRPTVAGSVELLRASMDEAGVDRAVTISPWPYRWDMSYVLDILPAHRSWLAVAVLVHPRRPDGPATLERYVRERRQQVMHHRRHHDQPCQADRKWIVGHDRA